MRRRLSSLQTVLVKIVLPALWIPMWGFAIFMMFIRETESAGSNAKWMFLLFWIVVSVFILWDCIRLKEVSVDENFLYVSNYLKEISMPLSEIYDVTENFWVNYHPVTIHLKSPSEFGDKIVFMPTTRFFNLFRSHPVVNELKELARLRY